MTDGWLPDLYNKDCYMNSLIVKIIYVYTYNLISQMGHEGLDLHKNRELDKSEDQTFKPELYARKAEEIIEAHDYTSVSEIYS